MLVVGVVFEPTLRIGRMFSGCFGNGPKDVVRAGEMMRDIDMNDLATPCLRWRNYPDEECEQCACQYSNMSPADIFADSGGYVTARGPDGRSR